MKKLDNPQQAIYEYIQAYYKENGFPPLSAKSDRRWVCVQPLRCIRI